MDDARLLRYSRQIMLPEIDLRGQEKLLVARVLIIGLGGLGAPVSMYLAAAGVGNLVLCDFDEVDLSNLQRQIIHGTPDIGKTKVSSAAETLSALNPEIHTTALAKRLDAEQLRAEVEKADVVVDCSDNFPTRFAVNAACVSAAVPLVSGAVIRIEGQVSVFAGRPCYRCLYPEAGTVDESCAGNGILAPMAGIIGSMQALETIKILLDIGTTLYGRLLIVDGRDMSWHELKLNADPACPVCASV